MGNSQSSPKISAQDKAILDLKNQRDKLHQYQKRITVLTTRETEIAKECLAVGKKPQALLALRRKKYQEVLLGKADAQLEQLQKLMADVEFAQLQAGVMEGLKQGNVVLKRIHEEMGGIEGVERLLEESAEGKAYEREVSEMLGGQLSRSEEDEVEEELEALRALEEGDRTRADKVGKLPYAPKNQPVRMAEEEEGAPEAPVKARRTVEKQPMLA